MDLNKRFMQRVFGVGLRSVGFCGPLGLQPEMPV